MSTAYVITTCCQAPVRLAFPDFMSESAEVICVCCGRTAGTPGAEDSPDVEEFIQANHGRIGRRLWESVNPS